MPLFSGICEVGRKLSFEINRLYFCLNFRQFKETTEKQRKIHRLQKLPKDLSTQTVDA